MEVIFNILRLLIGLSILILVHEFGHFVFAKLFKVYVYEFSLGMGPLLFQKKYGETKYSIRALPIGGYVAMAGENDGMVDEDPTLEIPKERTVGGIHGFKKFLIMFAGAGFNFVLAFIFLVIVIAGGGIADSSSKIAVVEGGNFDQVFQLKNGDQITSMEGILYDSEAKANVLLTFSDSDIKTYNEIVKVIESTTIKTEGDNKVTAKVGNMQCLKVGYLRDGVSGTTSSCITFTKVVVDEKGNITESLPKFGFGQSALNVGLFEAIGISAKMELELAGTIFTTIPMLFSPEGFSQISGPVGMYGIANQFASLGILAFIYFLAFISVNLGVVNLLPFPGLDGGRIIVLGIESVIRRKLNPKIEMIINSLGLLLLFGLMIAITFKDILNLF